MDVYGNNNFSSPMSALSSMDKDIMFTKVSDSWFMINLD